MADTSPNSTPSGSIGSSSFREPALRLKLGLAEMLKGGVIMDVMNVEQARIAEEAGAISVMALERVPAMIRAEGGVARMANPKLIREIMAAVTIPVMAKARIGHFAEAQVLQHLGVDFIDESEVLTPPTRPTTSTSTPSPRPSSAARAIGAKPSAASPRAQP
jgi:pyridoxal 5'-phosphate synthase pdxS subunit